MSSSMALRLRPKYITTINTTFIHCFSLSSTSDPNDTNPKDATPTSSDSSPKSQSSFASYFSDVKSSLKQQKQPHSQTQPRKSSFNTSTIRTPSTAASLGEIRKNLSEFRLRLAVPPPNETKDTTSPPSEQISFQELYKRNVAAKSSESPPEPGKDGRASFSLDAIRESLKQLKSSTPAAPNTDRRGSDAMSLSKYKESFKIRPQSGNVIGGGFETLPTSVFGKEMKEKNEGKSSTSASDMKTDFMKTYSFGELGEKMRMLRPEKEVDFSLDELNARLMKLREIEAKETESRKVGGVTFKDLRESLVKLKLSSEEKEKQTQIQKLGYLGQLGGTPNFMLAPPKEQLVEKYFHPDNLSSAEKLKIELQKVRDEFKMSESDCGSALVQGLAGPAKACFRFST